MPPPPPPDSPRPQLFCCIAWYTAYTKAVTKTKETTPFPALARAFLAGLVVERRRGDGLQMPSEYVFTVMGESRRDVLEWLGVLHDTFECPLV